MQNKKKRNVLIGALAVLLVAFAVGGTIAWLTSQSSLSNVFTVGTINTPTTDPDDEPLPDPSSGKVNGNLYEPNWEPNSKVTPGATVAKDPMVGLGKGSEDAYVFVYVDNNLTTDNAAEQAFFYVNPSWAPVIDQATPSTSSDDKVQAGAYTEGLFKYVGTGSDSTTPAYVLRAADGKDVWTNRSVFNNVTVPAAVTADDFSDGKNIDVYAFIYAAEGATPAEAEQAAIEWVDTLSD